MTTDNRKGQRGFTLVEVVIVISILGLVIAPITAALVLTFRTVDGARAQIEGATWTHLMTSYFLADVQSAKSISDTSIACSAEAPSGADHLVSATGDVPGLTDAPDETRVSWFLTTNDELVRVSCSQDDETTNTVATEISGASVTIGARVGMSVTGDSGETYTMQFSRRTDDP